MRCEPCGLAQLHHDLDSDELFHDAYGYRSSLNESMARHLGAIARDAIARAIPQPGDVVLDFLRTARAGGKLVHGYGASTKGNTTLQVCDVDSNLLPAIADHNADKHGCRTPGLNIPIISKEESRAEQPDYYFVPPRHFRSAFVQREREFLNRGGKFVFPLPRLEIVSA